MQSPQQIMVDLVQLREVCQALRRDTDEGLRPGLHRADQKIHQGVPFGRRSPSGEADAAARALAYALERYAGNSVGHLQRAEQITKLLDVILDDYAEADAISALTMETLLDRLDSGLAEIPKPPPTTEAQP